MKRESIIEETARVNLEYADRGIIGRCPEHGYTKTVSTPQCPMCLVNAAEKPGGGSLRLSG